MLIEDYNNNKQTKDNEDTYRAIQRIVEDYNQGFITLETAEAMIKERGVDFGPEEDTITQ